MNTLNLPNQYVLQALYNALNNQVVDGDAIPVYDSVVPGDELPTKYILLGSQANDSTEYSFLGYAWSHTVSIECYTRTPAIGNPGSRVACSKIANMVVQQLANLTIDAGANLRLHRITITQPGDAFIPDNNYQISQIAILAVLEFN